MSTSRSIRTRRAPLVVAVAACTLLACEEPEVPPGFDETMPVDTDGVSGEGDVP